VDWIQKIKDNKKFGQMSLFSKAGEKGYADFKLEPEETRE
jgi:hypothetical protein